MDDSNTRHRRSKKEDPSFDSYFNNFQVREQDDLLVFGNSGLTARRSRSLSVVNEININRKQFEYGKLRKTRTYHFQNIFFNFGKDYQREQQMSSSDSWISADVIILIIFVILQVIVLIVVAIVIWNALEEDPPPLEEELTKLQKPYLVL